MPLQISPKHERHGIAQATFAVDWEKPLDEEVFKSILDRHVVVADELPRKQVGRGVQITIGPGDAPVSTTHQQSIGSLVFDRVEPNGQTSWLVMVNPNHVLVTCSGETYTRWSEISTKALRYLSFVLENVLPARPIQVVALQYVDEFVWGGANPDDFTADKLFRTGGRHLVPAVFASTGLWHSHHGYFVRGEQPVRHRTLNNVNVNVIDTNDRRRIAQIVMAHRLFPDTPIAVFSRDLFEAGGLVSKLLKHLHDLDKEVLRGLLVPEMVAKIQLDQTE